jgi:hypothetical protein
MEIISTYTAFEGHQLLTRGPLSKVVHSVKKRLGKSAHSSILIFNDATGKTMDFNFHGTEKDVLKRLEIFVGEIHPEAPSGPGRPKLGVVTREVSLLPRHWEWLASQSGGASATLRKLVEDAKKKFAEGNVIKQAQERTYRFMSVIAGDLTGYEEALRALYKKDADKFRHYLASWPTAVSAHAIELAAEVFAAD